MQLTITGYSTALFATWYFIEELGILFDAGDGVTSALLQKSRKINHVFISHPDRDHLTGLLQLNQLNARPGFPVIYYPKNSSSFPALRDFSVRFDPQVSSTVWKPLDAGETVQVKEDISVVPVPNGHVPAAGGTLKSFSYKVVHTRTKLRPDLVSLPAEEIKRIIAEQGKAATSVEIKTNVLGYSGDTPVEDPERWNHSEILIHEATFLGGKADAGVTKHGNRHSTLAEVMEMVSGLQIGKLVLGHFSSRYSPQQIDAAIREHSNRYAINLPVFRVLPGQVVTGILNGPPVNG